jgi:hypothetical protein
MGVLLVVGGGLGNRCGKRRMFLLGIAGLSGASLTCGLAVDPGMLITARVIQGRLRRHPDRLAHRDPHHDLSRRAAGPSSPFAPVLSMRSLLGPTALRTSRRRASPPTREVSSEALSAKASVAGRMSGRISGARANRRFRFGISER